MTVVIEKQYGSVFVHSIVDKVGKEQIIQWKNLWDTRGIDVHNKGRNSGWIATYPQSRKGLGTYPPLSPKAIHHLIIKLSTRVKKISLDQIKLFNALSPLSTVPITTNTINIYKN